VFFFHVCLSVNNDSFQHSLLITQPHRWINFVYVIDIINVDDNYPYFKEDIKEGLIFATDLGDNVYYYGKGKEGVGLYIVGRVMETFLKKRQNLRRHLMTFLLKERELTF